MQKKANLIAVGTFLPEIEIWNLDSESCDPVAVLGSIDLSEKAKANTVVSKYKKNKAPPVAFSEDTHTDAIMSLSLNPFQSEYLASGSADHTVRIWDLDEIECKATYKNLHNDKVQAVRWNYLNEQILLTGGYDGKLNVVDVRDKETSLTYQLDKSISLDIESANWHPQSQHDFVVTTESGHLYGFDTRKFTEPVFTVKAHKKACSNASFSPHITNMLVTVGTDAKCKIWDIANVVDGKPECIQSKDMKQGELFSVQMYKDIPWVLATGGSKGELAIWDIEEDKKTYAHFKGSVTSKAVDSKKAADKGLMPDEAKQIVQEDMEDGDSGWEDVGSEEEDETKEEVEEKQIITSSKKDKKSSKKKKWTNISHLINNKNKVLVNNFGK